MSIIRGPRPDSNFYTLDKRISEDERLSWAARGLLVFLLGKPDNWTVSIEHLKRQTVSARIHSGRDALYGLIGELEAIGYVEREQQNEAGCFGNNRYIVREIPAPVFKQQPGLPLPENPDAVLPLPAQPYTAQPDTVHPLPANPLLTSTEVLPKTDSKQRQPRAKRTRVPAIEIPDWIPRTQWDAYVSMRNEIRKPMTDRAAELAIGLLDKLRGKGHEPGAVLDQSTFNNWQGLFALKGDNSAGHGGGGGYRRESTAERVERVNRELDERDHAE